MPAPIRAALGAALVLSSLAAPSAHAAGGPAKWTEWHARGDDVTLTVDAAGLARIEHAIRYRVVMGPFRQFDVTGIEKVAALAREATVTTEDGRELAAHTEPKSEGTFSVHVDDPKGLKRGTYTFRFHYDVHLVAAKELVRDGAMWQIVWRSPPFQEGYDGARVVVSVPAAETEPRPVKTGTLSDGTTAEPTLGGEDGVVTTLRRTPERDELELVRPHVARGESPLWIARVDPKAFPAVHTPELRPPAAAPPPEPNRVGHACWAALFIATGLLVGLLVRTKTAHFSEQCARARVKPAPLVGVRPGLAGLLAGILASAGAILQAAGWPTAGASLLALAMLFGVSRTPLANHAPRGPGRWLALRPDEAFASDVARGHWLDLGTPAGKVAALAAVAGVAGLSVVSRAIAPEAPYLIALDALALLPLVMTGRAAQLPPGPTRAARLLVTAFRALKKDAMLKVAPWARVPVGASSPDELRLLAVPRASLPGLLGIELGVAWSRTCAGYAPRAEVLVRVHEATDAAARVGQLAAFCCPVTGRKAEERVVRLTPCLPGTAAAVSLVQRLASELADRRVRMGGWEGAERRVFERTDRVPAAA